MDVDRNTIMFARTKTLLLGSPMVLGPRVALAQTDAVVNLQKRVLYYVVKAQ